MEWNSDMSAASKDMHMTITIKHGANDFLSDKSEEEIRSDLVRVKLALEKLGCIVAVPFLGNKASD